MDSKILEAGQQAQPFEKMRELTTPEIERISSQAAAKMNAMGSLASCVTMVEQLDAYVKEMRKFVGGARSPGRVRRSGLGHHRAVQGHAAADGVDVVGNAGKSSPSAGELIRSRRCHNRRPPLQPRFVGAHIGSGVRLVALQLDHNSRLRHSVDGIAEDDVGRESICHAGTAAILCSKIPNDRPAACRDTTNGYWCYAGRTRPCTTSTKAARPAIVAFPGVMQL